MTEAQEPSQARLSTESRLRTVRRPLPSIEVPYRRQDPLAESPIDLQSYINVLRRLRHLPSQLMLCHIKDVFI